MEVWQAGFMFLVSSQLLGISSFLFSDSTKECYLISTSSLSGLVPFINFSLKKKKLEFLFSRSLRSSNSSISEECNVVKGLQEAVLEHLICLYRFLAG